MFREVAAAPIGGLHGGGTLTFAYTSILLYSILLCTTTTPSDFLLSEGFLLSSLHLRSIGTLQLDTALVLASHVVDATIRTWTQPNIPRTSTMKRSQSIQRVWITNTQPRIPTRLHLSASARCRMDLPLEHSRRRNQYQTYPTRLRGRDETAIKEYLAEPDHNSAVAGFLASIAFVHGITGYRFTDGYLLLQALYGDQASENPHQRLALLGDMLLQYILKDDWFRLNLSTSKSRVVLDHTQSQLLTAILQGVSVI